MNQDEEKKIWGFVYIFDINGKKYVGQAINLKQRLLGHLKEKKVNLYFHNSLRKYFQFGCFRIIESRYDNKQNLKSFLNEREMFWIVKLNTYDTKQEKGWNLTKGGEGRLGFKATKETLEKMSINHLDVSGEKNPMFGKPNTNLGERNKKRVGINNPNFGKKFPEQSKRMKERAEQGIFPRTCPVILISPENKEFHLPHYKTFCKENNLLPTGICNLLKGRVNQYKGWTGKYV